MFAGGLAWSRYDTFARVVMRLLLGNQPGADLDSTHDHDYTDWDAVRRFADAFGETVERRRDLRPAPPRPG